MIYRCMSPYSYVTGIHPSPCTSCRLGHLYRSLTPSPAVKYHPIPPCYLLNFLRKVGGLLSIMMCIFEVFSAALTTIRSIQALQVAGPWHTQKRGFMYMLLEQGVFSSTVFHTLADLPGLGVLYFWCVFAGVLFLCS